MRRIAVIGIGLAMLFAACDRIVELSPPPDGPSSDGGLDGQQTDGDGGILDGNGPDAEQDAGVPQD